MKRSTHIQKQKTQKFLIVIAIVLGLSFSLLLPSSPTRADDTAESLRNQTEALEQKIANNQDKLEDAESQSATLRDRIAGLENEITIANDKIELTNKKIETLKIEVAEAEAELERQRGLLEASLVALYKQGDVTTIELLAASDSYSEFINEQEYLERLKSGIQDSADRVEQLKAELEAQQQEQEDLLKDQQAQRRVLSNKRSEQRQLLDETEGEEAKYREVIADLEEQRRQAEEELKRYLASLVSQNFTSLGYVVAGTAIGLVGSSGFSTGPHLHFAITDGTSFFDPVAGGGALSYGMQWPLPNSSWANVTQSYGCVAPASWYVTKCNGGLNSFHGGLDISGWYGDPVTAAADGDIVFRGWLGGYGNTVIIQHDNGLFTYYPHLLE